MIIGLLNIPPKSTTCPKTLVLPSSMACMCTYLHYEMFFNNIPDLYSLLICIVGSSTFHNGCRFSMTMSWPPPLSIIDANSLRSLLDLVITINYSASIYKKGQRRPLSKSLISEIEPRLYHTLFDYTIAKALTNLSIEGSPIEVSPMSRLLCRFPRRRGSLA